MPPSLPGRSVGISGVPSLASNDAIWAVLPSTLNRPIDAGAKGGRGPMAAATGGATSSNSCNKPLDQAS